MIAPEWVERVRAGMTELPRVMAARFAADYGLSDYDATALTQSREVAHYFEATSKLCGQPKLVGNWIMGEISRRLNQDGIEISQAPVKPDSLAWLVGRIHDGTISNNNAKVAFDHLWKLENVAAVHLSAPSPIMSAAGTAANVVDQVIEKLGLKQMNDSGALEKIVDAVLAANPKNVAEFRAGNARALNALVGQIMKGSQGKANPQQAGDLLKQKLAS